jgi:hypothetical protein
MKHIQGMKSMPEKAVDEAMDGQLSLLYREQEKNSQIIVHSEGKLPYASLCIINFHKENLPFRYSSVATYARRIAEFATQNEWIASVATAVHGPGAGLDASEAMETMLEAFADEIQAHGHPGRLREVLFVERDSKVAERLRERLRYLSGKGLISFREDGVFLEPSAARRAGSDDLLKRHLFVAMPYAKSFENIYYFGIKQPAERQGRVCERVDQDQFVGDVVQRIKERIKAAELVIADLTGLNTNVVYELGYAEGLGKEVILMVQRQEESRIPFDLRAQRQIFYEPENIIGLADHLEKLLKALLGRR